MFSILITFFWFFFFVVFVCFRVGVFVWSFKWNVRQSVLSYNVIICYMPLFICNISEKVVFFTFKCSLCKREEKLYNLCNFCRCRCRCCCCSWAFSPSCCQACNKMMSCCCSCCVWDAIVGVVVLVLVFFLVFYKYVYFVLVLKAFKKASHIIMWGFILLFHDIFKILLDCKKRKNKKNKEEKS